MRKMIAALALTAACVILPGSALADEMGDKLLAMCKAGDPKPETCECQVKAMTDNVDAKVLEVLVATAGLPETATQADRDKATADALAAAGLTQEEYDAKMKDGMAKAVPAMEACSK